jgi:hypothetical protein
MTKYNGLRKKWWNGVKAELKSLELPEPAHEMGFTDEQLKESLSATEYKNFWRWMYGQTMALDDKGRPIAYLQDVLRGVRLVRYGTPTYFD